MTSLRLALTLLTSLALAACPGRITDPTPFIGPSGEGGISGCSIPSSQIETQLIRPRCATQGCHDRGDRAGGLDLQTPGVASRLLGQPSQCMGQPLVDPTNRAGSYFVRKLEGSGAECGRRMPLGQPPFSPSDIACVRSWVALLDPTPPGADASADASADVPSPPTDAQTASDAGADARPTDVVITSDGSLVDVPLRPDAARPMDAAASDAGDREAGAPMDAAGPDVVVDGGADGDPAG